VIKGIQKIKALGVFSDYTRPAGTQNFAVKNVIYGWNYSGKTTLSRLFALLEAKQSNPDLAGCSFTFDTDQGQITEANYIHSALTVRVFNSDFIAKNLNFSGQAFNPILLLGEGSEEAQKKLDHCEAMAIQVRQRSNDVGQKIKGLEDDLSTAKTKAAARIKKEIGLVAAYTAVHLDKDILAVNILDESQTLSDAQYKADLKLALTSDQERPARVDPISVSLSLAGLYDEAQAIMAKTPSLASTIDHLVKNPLIERWVETGLPLHSANDKCEFCGGDLTKHRLAELQAHFSKDLAEHKQKVDQLLSRVERAKVVVALPKEVELNAQFREPYATVSAQIKAPVDAFNNAVADLAKDLRKKIDAPFEALIPRSLPEPLIEPVEEAIAAVNAIIEDNNKVVDNFVSAKRDAVERLKCHYAQEFIDMFDKDGRDKKLALLEHRRKRLARFGGVVHEEIQRLKAIISQAQRGREKINERLEALLGSHSVQIKIVPFGDQERFQLVRRDGRVATNLSEGEKTAIAFTYFLTKLKELKEHEFKETIVYIDDPISSLDSNHIFQIHAIIKETFFHKDPANNSWTTKCKQVFVSTHNFEFFSLIRELDPKKDNSAKLYLVRKVRNQESSLGDMPKSLGKYSSEYHFLFDIINRFQKAPDKTEPEILMLLPNAIRRFVELYTFSRYPGDIKSTVDQRADILFGAERSKRILKVLHYFSHAASIDRLAENNELIFDTEAAVNDLFTAIRETDQLHMDALEAAVAN
jgi:wobble nucleotide-excising tRNase